ncbi:type I methionyl aminopeptidase [Candidatus Gracilibacteria bacterium]|nr:type I methionyl aminopeptidase [Candidatus Gracilibacteria bacterium]MCF7898455.1 type I methionyl aminopeptidase [Candidatus Paceibacterota bacterium]
MKYNIKLKNEKDIIVLRESCKRLAVVLQTLAKEVKPGVTTGYLNDLAYKLITEKGDKPAFLNYQPFGASYAYPGSVCISVNDEVVHGIGGDRVLKEGDIVGIDGGVTHKGMISDSAVTVAVGKISKEDEELMRVTKEALMAGIKAAKGGNYVNDISKAIEKSIPKKYGIVKILSGHGVGYKVHEEPYVPNFDDGVKGPKLVPGLVLALEPMVNHGTDEVYLADDGYTFITKDHKKSAHFEHTILITEGEAEILTSW